MSEYTPEKYATLEDALDHFGWTKLQIQQISDTDRNRLCFGNDLICFKCVPLTHGYDFAHSIPMPFDDSFIIKHSLYLNR